MGFVLGYHKIFILCVTFFVLAGCQTLTQIDFEPIQPQQKFFVDGGVAVKSSKAKSGVILAANSQETINGQRIQLALGVINTGQQEFTIDTENLVVESYSGERFKVYSYAELVKEEVDRRNLQLVLAAISGAANAYSASQAGTSHSSGTFRSSTTNNSGNMYSTSGTFSSTTHDPYKSQIAQQQASIQSANNIRAISDRTSSNLATLKSSILKKTTVFPSSSHSGLVVFDAPPLKKGEIRKYTLILDVADEKHRFTLAQTIQNKS